MIDHIYKYPRLYINAPFKENASLVLAPDHVHYLRNVLRNEIGDIIRIFNGVDGEWLAKLSELSKRKGQAVLTDQVKVQPEPENRLKLIFSPIKKNRMQIMIEKAVELGVTDLQPVLMHRSERIKLNTERVSAQIIEAAEQCERLDLPRLHDAEKFLDYISLDRKENMYVCLERCNKAAFISSYDFKPDCCFIIGPEGGFDDEERDLLLARDYIKKIVLGERILRAETAAISCLSYANFMRLSI